MLIKCPECNKEVSDKAETCPHCGIRLKEAEVKQGSNSLSKRASLIINRDHKWGCIAGIISGVFLIILSIVLFIISFSFSSSFDTSSLAITCIFSLLAGIASIIISVYRLKHY